MATTKEHFEMNTNRYVYDFIKCTPSKGFAQIDSNQTAWYFGQWANPFDRIIVTYAEGDVIITTCDDDADFSREIRKMAEWGVEHEHGFKIDPMLRPEIEERFKALGLGDLLH